MKKQVLVIVGTRPEAIKLAPLIQVFEKSINWECKVHLTGQHKKAVREILEMFQLKSTIYERKFAASNSLAQLTSQLLKDVNQRLEKLKPDLVVVQGDTTSALAGALGSFYAKIPIVHIEAGLRSYQAYAPFPEEMNRKLITQLATFHFAPTKKAQNALKKEAIQTQTWTVGNTVIDALKWLRSHHLSKHQKVIHKKLENQGVKWNKKIIVVTAHRRESWGKNYEEVLGKVLLLVEQCEDIQVVFPIHLNPELKTEIVGKIMRHPRIQVLDPLPYPEFLYLVTQCYLLISDSGGVQEEAPYFGKPVLVIRDYTERMEPINKKCSFLVGQNGSLLIEKAIQLINKPDYYKKTSKKLNVYGDGNASKRILSILTQTM